MRKWYACSRCGNNAARLDSTPVGGPFDLEILMGNIGKHFAIVLLHEDLSTAMRVELQEPVLQGQAGLLVLDDLDADELLRNAHSEDHRVKVGLVHVGLQVPQP